MEIILFLGKISKKYGTPQWQGQFSYLFDKSITKIDTSNYVLRKYQPGAVIFCVN